MNILYIPQLSMHDKVTGKYIPESDGNLNMMRNFIKEWKKNRPEDNFFVVLPDQIDTRELNIDCKYFLYKNYVVSARINRFNFPMKELSEQFMHWNFDLVINDIPELSRNIISMFEVLLGQSPKIMSNIHHMDDINDTKTKYNYFMRVFDAIECSDYVTILSESMKDMLDKAMMKYFSLGTRIKFMSKVFVFEPSVSHYELSQLKKSFHYKEEDKKIITFPGRLSEGEDKRTNYNTFLNAIYLLREERQDFVVYLTDPNNVLGITINTDFWINTINKDRIQFLNLLEQTDIIVSLMAIQGFGGIAIREALQYGCMPVIPFTGEYKKMKPEYYEGFIEGEITVSKIVDVLNFTLNNADYYKQYISADSIKEASKFTIEYQMPQLLKHMEGVLNG